MYRRHENEMKEIKECERCREAAYLERKTLPLYIDLLAPDLAISGQS